MIELRVPEPVYSGVLELFDRILVHGATVRIREEIVSTKEDLLTAKPHVESVVISPDSARVVQKSRSKGKKRTRSKKLNRILFSIQQSFKSLPYDVVIINQNN